MSNTDKPAGDNPYVRLFGLPESQDVQNSQQDEDKILCVNCAQVSSKATPIYTVKIGSRGYSLCGICRDAWKDFSPGQLAFDITPKPTWLKE